MSKSHRDGSAERSEKARDPHGEHDRAEEDRADRDDTMLQKGERVPTSVTNVVVGALQNDDGNDGHDRHNEWVQVKRFVEVTREECDARAREPAAGAGVTRHDGEGTNRDMQNVRDDKHRRDERDVAGTT